MACERELVTLAEALIDAGADVNAVSELTTRVCMYPPLYAHGRSTTTQVVLDAELALVQGGLNEHMRRFQRKLHLHEAVAASG
eukprot:1818-Eustigmatos_ZCMA.PRE.1